MTKKKTDLDRTGTPQLAERRKFLKQAGLLAAGAQAGALLPLALSTSHAAAAESAPVPTPAAVPAQAKQATKSAGASTGEVIVETNNGKVRGLNMDGTKIFKGIPYGADTSGRNRFLAPVRPTPWPGVRDATQWGHTSPMYIQAGAVDYMKMIDWLNQPGPQGEDCLVVNVWTPGVKDGRKRPVMFWLHGGGFVNGSSGNPGFDGYNLARKHDVVVVSLNHRLGCLGYLHLGDLGSLPEFSVSGNAGMLDCVLALEWVRDNIEQFGGDPGSVMIFGQSGGGRKVCTLMTMPSAQGLFHRAIIESGAELRVVTREEGTKMAQGMLDTVGLEASRIPELQTLPVEQLIAAQTMMMGENTLGFGPIMDGNILPQHPFDPAASPLSANIPVIIGTVRSESAITMGNVPRLVSIDAAGLDKEARSMFKGNADRVLSTYRRLYPQLSPYQLLLRMATDSSRRIDAITLAERKVAQHGAPVYMYWFTWPSPAFGGRYDAVHGTEVPLVFGNLDPNSLLTGDGPEARALSDKLGAAWTAFTKTGNPSTKELPQWPAYTMDTRATMNLGATCQVENDPSHDVRVLWQELKS